MTLLALIGDAGAGLRRLHGREEEGGEELSRGQPFTRPISGNYAECLRRETS